MAKRARPTFRGADFTMRWQQGKWSEERILEAFNSSAEYRAVPYGRSSTSDPAASSAELDEYWEAYSAIESVGKRPDLLLLRMADFEELEGFITDLGDPTIHSDDDLQPILDRAICGIEAENSLWRGREMPDYGRREITRLNFVAPTIIVKQEDLPSLIAWQDHFDIPIVIIHVFYDEAYVASLQMFLDAISETHQLSQKNKAAGLSEKEITKASQSLQKEQGIIHKVETYTDSRGGSTKKIIYRMHHTRAAIFGNLDEDDPPQLLPQAMFESNGKVVPFVSFSGGSLDLAESGLEFFRKHFS